MVFFKPAPVETPKVDAPTAKAVESQTPSVLGPVLGTCKHFGSSYGFFELPGGIGDVFAHVTKLPKEGDKFIRPADGGRVKFSYQPSTKKPGSFEVAGGDGSVEVIDRR